MKKAIIALVAAIALCGAASAQYYSYGFINSGEKSYSIGIGTVMPVTPYLMDEEHTVYNSQTPHFPAMAAVLRGAREFHANEVFSWGYQYELNWMKYGADYNKTVFDENFVGTLERWDLRFEIRLTFGFYLSDNLEILFGIGGGEAFVNGYTDNYTVTSVSGASTEQSIDEPIDFGGYTAGSVLLAVNCRLNDNLFTFINLRGDALTKNFGGVLAGGPYSYRLVPMVGLGVTL